MTMHRTPQLLCAIAVSVVIVVAAPAVAGTETSALDMPPAPPSLGPGMGPGMGRGMGPGGHAAPAQEPEEPSPLDKLADQPSRPVWGPLPVFRGELAMVPLLHGLLKDADATTRARSALVLGQIGCPSSLEALAAGLEDPDREVRVQCGIALGCMGDARGTATCSYALVSDPEWIRFYAAYGLWSINTDRARSALRSRQAGQTPFIAGVIKSALQTKYAAPTPVPPLAAGAKTEPRPSLQQLWEQAADVFVNESDWWFHAGDYDQVIRASEPSIFLDPEYVETYSVVAWLQWSMGDDATAIRTLRRAVAAVPESAEAYFNLGYHYFNTKRYAEAEPYLDRAVKLGGDILTQRSYAHCLERLGKLQKCLDFWETILKANPTDGVAILNRDRVKARLAEEK